MHKVKVYIVTTHPPIQYPKLYYELSKSPKIDFKVFCSSSGQNEQRNSYKNFNVNKTASYYFIAKERSSKFRFFKYFNLDLIFDFLKKS